MITLRDYQRKAEKDIGNFIESNQKRGIVVSPVATGKSIYTSIFAKHSDTPTVVIQPTKELLEQNYQKALSFGLNPTIYSASLGVKEISDLIFATPGSIIKAVDKLGHIDLVAIDECHLNMTRQLKRGRITKLSQTEQLIKKINPKKVMGLTATPIMLIPGLGSSKIQMINRTKRSFFNGAPIVHLTQIQDIHKKYWSDMEYENNPNYDKSSLKLNSTGNDFTEKSIIEAFEFNNGVDAIVDKIDTFLKRGRKKILIFVPNLEIGRKLEERDSRVKGVYGDTDKVERDNIIQDFKEGDTQVIANYGTLTTGFDSPNIDTVIIARDTNSFQLYLQMIGRGVRLFPNKKTLIFDMCSNYERFGDIRDISFEDDPSTKGWAMFKKDTVLTGFPLSNMEDYPTRQELMKVIEDERQNHGGSFPINPTLMFGKHAGKTLLEVAKKDMAYLEWIWSNSDFQFRGKSANIKAPLRRLFLNKQGLND